MPQHELVSLLERSLMRWMDSEDTYEAILAEYMDKHGVGAIADERARAAQAGIADADAATDRRLKRAVSHGQWYRDRAQTAALAILARAMVRQVEPQSTKEST